MANKEDAKCGLKDFFYHEYDVYTDFIKLSEENRDKYFRMYLITISVLIGYASKLYYDIGPKTSNGLNTLNDRFLITIIIILALIFLLSFVIARILCSGRKGNRDCVKRVNVLRNYLLAMEGKNIEKNTCKNNDKGKNKKGDLYMIFCYQQQVIKQNTGSVKALPGLW